MAAEQAGEIRLNDPVSDACRRRRARLAIDQLKFLGTAAGPIEELLDGHSRRSEVGWFAISEAFSSVPPPLK